MGALLSLEEVAEGRLAGVGDAVDLAPPGAVGPVGAAAGLAAAPLFHHDLLDRPRFLQPAQRRVQRPEAGLPGRPQRLQALLEPVAVHGLVLQEAEDGEFKHRYIETIQHADT